jgi:hypothetical protein
MQMRHCRNLRSSAGAHEATDATVKDPTSVGLLDETGASTVDMKGMGFNAYYADEAGQSRTAAGLCQRLAQAHLPVLRHRRGERAVASPA